MMPERGRSSDPDLPSEVYHENSKLHAMYKSTFALINAVNTSPEIGRIVTAPAANYPGAPVVCLPKETPERASEVESVIVRRRSCREFTGHELWPAEVSRILYAGYGLVGTLTTDLGVSWPLRAAPSAGGLGCLELYPVVLAVEGVPEGIYFYNSWEQCLEQVRPGNFRPDLSAAVGVGQATDGAGLGVVITACMPRIRFKYAERSYRFALLEAGHVAQNILIAAEANGLGALPVGGFLDDAIADMIDLDGVTEIPLYVILIGRSSSKDRSGAAASAVH